MPTKQTPNEMSSKWWGPCGLQPFPGHVSSSRLQMFASHLGQMLVLNGSTERSIQTGMEREYGKYTFKVEMPCNGLILDIIERYPTTMGIDTIQHNPLTVVIYENVDTKEVGIINLVDYCSNHQYFGFRFAKKKGLNLLRIGGTVPKGTIFLDSPSITDAHDLSRRFIVASKAVEQVVIPSPKTPAAKFWVNFDGACSIAVYEADARKVVEALGGTWPEPQPAPEVKP